MRTSWYASAARKIVAFGICMSALTATGQDHYISVDVTCCGVRQNLKFPVEPFRGSPDGQIGALSLSCSQFFYGGAFSYGGGWPRSDGTRTLNIGASARNAVMPRICTALQSQGKHCCDASAFCPDNCGGIQQPNPRTAELFDKLYTGLADGSDETDANKIAVSRFLSNCESEKLLDDIINMPCPAHWRVGRPGCKLGDYIRFKLRFRNRMPDDPEAGSTFPGQPFPDPSPGGESDPEAVKRFHYVISITHQPDGDPAYLSAFPHPDNACFSYTRVDGSSAMASTLHHELLHIWWMNKQQTDFKTDSGHTSDTAVCSAYKRDFVLRLRDFSRVMDNLERCIKGPVDSWPQPGAKPSPVKPNP